MLGTGSITIRMDIDKIIKEGVMSRVTDFAVVGT